MRARLSLRLAAALTSGLIAAALGITLAATASAAARQQDPVPIGPNEYFSGYINNHPPGKAVIKVVCPGPAQKTGHPAGNQHVEVKTVSPTSTFDVGYTGSAGNTITAALAPAASTNGLASFKDFFLPKLISTKIVVPCSGTGTVVFAPSPGSSTAKSATLPVTFENIAT